MGTGLSHAVVATVAQINDNDLVVASTPGPVRNSDIATPSAPTLLVTEKLAYEHPVLQKYTDMEDLLLLDPIHDVDEAGWPARKQPVEGS